MCIKYSFDTDLNNNCKYVSILVTLNIRIFIKKLNPSNPEMINCYIKLKYI